MQLPKTTTHSHRKTVPPVRSALQCATKAYGLIRTQTPRTALLDLGICNTRALWSHVSVFSVSASLSSGTSIFPYSSFTSTFYPSTLRLTAILHQPTSCHSANVSRTFFGLSAVLWDCGRCFYFMHQALSCAAVFVTPAPHSFVPIHNTPTSS
jgi:hypothetical protein